jgi:enamine deaminase RidA (YjgF/YER057c/UK114 family)
MRALLKASLSALLLASTAGAQVHPVELAGAKDNDSPPRSPAVDAGDYVYTSGQDGARADGTLPDGFAGQARQALENLKTLVTAAGLTMDNVVYVQVYLADIGNYTNLAGPFRAYFPSSPPAGAVLGVAKLRRGAIEINAVAVRDLAGRKAVMTGNQTGLFSPGMLTHDRLFVSAQEGRDPGTQAIPEDPGAQTDLALDGLRHVVDKAGLTMKHFVFVNPYLTRKIPTQVMNERYAQRFEFGNTPARATIQVSALPGNAQIEYTGVAVRDLRLRRAIRPKNMAPSPTASPCVFAGETLYCSAKSGFIPGPNGGVYASATGTQLRQTMRNQLDNLEEAEMSFADVVSTTVYLDNLSDSGEFAGVYREYFSGAFPAQTVVQQVGPATRSTDAKGHHPDLEQMSLIAVKRRSPN